MFSELDLAELRVAKKSQLNLVRELRKQEDVPFCEIKKAIEKLKEISLEIAGREIVYGGFVVRR